MRRAIQGRYCAFNASIRFEAKSHEIVFENFSLNVPRASSRQTISRFNYGEPGFMPMSLQATKQYMIYCIDIVARIVRKKTHLDGGVISQGLTTYLRLRRLFGHGFLGNFFPNWISLHKSICFRFIDNRVSIDNTRPVPYIRNERAELFRVMLTLLIFRIKFSS